MKIKKISAVFILVILCSMLFSACNDYKLNKPKQTHISIYCGTTMRLDPLLTSLHAQFPDYVFDIEYYNGNDEGIEYSRRLKNNDLSDIMFVKFPQLNNPALKNTIAELSYYDFAEKYGMELLKTVNHSSDVYYIPGPLQIRGLVYNKTLFQENSWEIPKNEQQAAQLKEKMDAKGIKMIQWPLVHPDVVEQVANISFLYNNCNSENGLAWYQKYYEGNPEFQNYWDEALNRYRNEIKSGIISYSDFTIGGWERKEKFINRECAVIESEYFETENDEIAMIPYSADNGETFVQVTPVYYIGMKKYVDKAKKNIVNDVFSYIVSQEGMDKMNEAQKKGTISNLSDISISDDPFFSYIKDTAESGHAYIFPDLSPIRETVYNSLKELGNNGTKTNNEILLEWEEAWKTIDTQKEPVIAVSTEEFSLPQTSDYLAEVMKNATGSQIALVDGEAENAEYGIGISAKIYKGDLTARDLSSILPAYSKKNQNNLNIKKGTITGSNLKNLVENCSYIKKLGPVVAPSNVTFKRFFYGSGIEFIYRESEDGTHYIAENITVNGKTIKDDHLYTVAYIQRMDVESYMTSVEFDYGDIVTFFEQQLKNTTLNSPESCSVSFIDN